MGLKKLLETAMRCSLRDVAVYVIRELALDTWFDVEHYLSPEAVIANHKIMELIHSVQGHYASFRGEVSLTLRQACTAVVNMCIRVNPRIQHMDCVCPYFHDFRFCGESVDAAAASATVHTTDNIERTFSTQCQRK